jgi:hypothetical protein
MGEVEEIKEEEVKEPQVTYIEGVRIRTLRFQRYDSNDPAFMTFYRKDGVVVKINRQFVIKIEYKKAVEIGQSKLEEE